VGDSQGIGLKSCMRLEYECLFGSCLPDDFLKKQRQRQHTG